MKLNNEIAELIEYASDRGFPVHINKRDVVIDSFANGFIYVYYNDASEISIMTRRRYSPDRIISSDEFKDRIDLWAGVM
ncbi:hypothetical protein RE773_000395 [Salmonella enterica]|nr:hypothetical protein [Salmonella enterica]EKY8868056.1 hypothetical protein [Salmonella enterica]EKY8978674.1 hypothetical protein [Salmonella enterica]EKZ8156287.1 hypothetical protein [Salmonella enterica]ELF2381139.1 hypothetical protein [Salmonella enterica]